MRLIDAPIGIFRFDGELVLKTEYYSENKRSGKYIPDCYIVRSGEYFWGGAKTANELINLDVEPVDFSELLPTVTDTISRQAALDIFDDYNVAVENGQIEAYSRDRKRLCDLPPALPEKRTEERTETHGVCLDTISRQAAIDALWAERMKHSEEMERNLETCSFALRADNKAKRNRIEEDIEIIKQLPPARLEIDILAWLLAYHTKSFELRGRYLPYEVIGWLIADFRKQYMSEGNEKKEGPC